jgi:hypothetical protein
MFFSEAMISDFESASAALYNHFSCSISLYAINLMKVVVPENHTQWSNRIHRIRRLTPDDMAIISFGRCFKAMPKAEVSSFMVELSRIFGPGSCDPAGVMY